MGLAHMNYPEDSNSGKVEEFTSHYKEEVMKQVTLIREELAKVDENPEEIGVFAEVQKSGCIISDLAMIYGYEGVEVIGSRLVEAIDNFTEDTNLGDLIIKLENATKAIEDAMSLVDERKERKIIRELSQYPKVEEEKPDIEEEIVEENQDRVNENIFDIREDEKLISLLSDTDGQAVEIQQKNDEEDVEDIDADSILGEHYSNINFDIPKTPNSDDNEVDEIVDSDVLEIDFKNKDAESKNESDGLFKKIGSLFGKKNKNRITYQE